MMLRTRTCRSRQEKRGQTLSPAPIKKVNQPDCIAAQPRLCRKLLRDPFQDKLCTKIKASEAKTDVKSYYFAISPLKRALLAQIIGANISVLIKNLCIFSAGICIYDELLFFFFFFDKISQILLTLAR